MWLRFWILILILIIGGILISIVSKIMSFTFSDMKMPMWVTNFPYWEIFGLLIALIIVACLLSMIIKHIKKV